MGAVRSGITSSIGPRWLRYTVAWTGHHAPRSRFRHLSYWLFGAWLLELCMWTVVLGVVAMNIIVWQVIKVSVVGLLAFGAFFTWSANWWFDRRAERRARDGQTH